MEKILIYGGSGLIGSKAVQLLSDKFDIIAPTHQDIDLTNHQQIAENIDEVNPTQILYASGYTSIDQAKQQVEEAFALCCGAISKIVEKAADKKIPFHCLSTEVVFNGHQSKRPYKETDQTDPLSILASLKRLGELITLKGSLTNSVIRLVVYYSPTYHHKKDLANIALDKLRKGETFTATTDQVLNLTYGDDLINAISAILQNHASGIYHTGATDYTTPFEFVKKLAKAFGIDKNLVLPLSFEEFSKTRPEPRPQYQWLDTKKFRRDFGEGILHTIDEGICLFEKNISS